MQEMARFQKNAHMKKTGNFDASPWADLHAHQAEGKYDAQIVFDATTKFRCQDIWLVNVL